MKNLIKKIINYIFKKIYEMKIQIILDKYQIDTKSFENGRQIGYQKGFQDGIELIPNRNSGVSKSDHEGLVRYLVTHNLEFYYTSNSTEGSGLMIRYKDNNK